MLQLVHKVDVTKLCSNFVYKVHFNPAYLAVLAELNKAVVLMFDALLLVPAVATWLLHKPVLL